MNLEMTPTEIIGLKTELPLVLQTLREVGCVQIDALSESPDISARPLALDPAMLRRQEELSFLTARIGGLLDVLGDGQLSETISTPSGDYLEEARDGVETLMPKVQALTIQQEKLEAELASLPGYEKTLKKLIPIIPRLAHEAGSRTIGVLVKREHTGILDSIGKQVLDLTGGHAEIVASDVDTTMRAMLIVFPDEFTNQIETLLGSEDISRLRLPTEFGKGSPDDILASMQRRMSEIPKEIAVIEEELRHLSVQWRGKLAVWRAVLEDDLEATQVLPHFGETDMTFVIASWIPTERIPEVKTALTEKVGETVFIKELPLDAEMKKRAPVQLQNPAIIRPFESLTNLLALPRYGHIDPSSLMAFFLPIFFGMMLGDVGYGALALIISLVIRRKFKAGIARDILTVLAMGAGWAIIFGFLYGEAFGTLGEELGMHAIWFDRASSEHVPGLLLMTLAIGAVHITLGLVIGLWEAAKDKSRSHLLERGGMLIGLIGLFFLVGVLTNYLPRHFMNLAIASTILGVVLLSVSIGWLGIAMGTIEFIGLIGNILSYLRIAAIGLASVYLAKVANEVAGMAGNVIVGAIIAILIHALNLVLGMFSPTIHSLRLHYVEFFRKFYEGGGRPYEPFRSRLNR